MLTRLLASLDVLLDLLDFLLVEVDPFEVGFQKIHVCLRRLRSLDPVYLTQLSL